MVDACTITRPGAGVGTFDPVTGETGAVARATVYTGRCSVTPREVVGQDRPAAGQVITVDMVDVAIPYGVTAVEVDDTVTITASLDPDAVGRDLVVQSVRAYTTATARRLVCVDDQG